MNSAARSTYKDKVDSVKEELDLLHKAKIFAGRLGYVLKQKEEGSSRIARWSQRASASELQLAGRYAEHISSLTTGWQGPEDLMAAQGILAQLRLYHTQDLEEVEALRIFKVQFVQVSDNPTSVYSIANEHLDLIEAYVTKYGSEPSVPRGHEQFGILRVPVLLQIIFLADACSTEEEIKTIREELLSQLENPTVELSDESAQGTAGTMTLAAALAVVVAATAWLLSQSTSG